MEYTLLKICYLSDHSSDLEASLDVMAVIATQSLYSCSYIFPCSKMTRVSAFVLATQLALVQAATFEIVKSSVDKRQCLPYW
jgi:hypothetical protein